MRFILLTILTIISVVILNPWIPFWGVMVVIGILSTAIYPSGMGGFFGGGLGMSLAWLGQCFYFGIATGSPLPDQVANLLGLGSSMTLVAITCGIGFLLGSFSGWTGVLFRQLIQKNHEN